MARRDRRVLVEPCGSTYEKVGPGDDKTDERPSLYLLKRGRLRRQRTNRGERREHTSRRQSGKHGRKRHRQKVRDMGERERDLNQQKSCPRRMQRWTGALVTILSPCRVSPCHPRPWPAPVPVCPSVVLAPGPGFFFACGCGTCLLGLSVSSLFLVNGCCVTAVSGWICVSPTRRVGHDISGCACLLSFSYESYMTVDIYAVWKFIPHRRLTI